MERRFLFLGYVCLGLSRFKYPPQSGPGGHAVTKTSLCHGCLDFYKGCLDLLIQEEIKFLIPFFVQQLFFHVHGRIPSELLL